MKRKLLILGLLVVMLVALTGATMINSADRNRMNFGSILKQFTSAQSVYELVAGQTNKHFVIDHIMLSCDVIGNVYLQEGTTPKYGTVYLAARSPYVDTNPNIIFSDGEGIDYISTIASGQTVYIEYHTE